jgi:general secretion pathway protein J
VRDVTDLQALDSPAGDGAPAAVRRARAGGFTLLELLVTLVVLGLLMATLTRGIRLGLRARDVEARITAGDSQLETTSRVLRTLISRAEPGDPYAPDAAFTGTPHAVSFVTTLPEGFGAAGAREADVSLGVEPGRHLVLRWRPHYRRWIVPPPPPSAVTLVDGVERVDLGFWQPGANAAAGSWVAALEAAEPPKLVRVRVVFPAGDPRRWPDIVAAPVQEALRP